MRKRREKKALVPATPDQIFLDALETQVGGRQRLIDALICVDSPTGRKLVAALGAAPGRPLWDVLREHRFNPLDLSKALTTGELARATAETMIKLADCLPEVLEASANCAKNAGVDGFSDRKLLMEMAGLTKGASAVQVNLNQQFNFGQEGSFERILQADRQPKNPFDIEIEVEEK